jgi:hypothetical protein
MLMRDLKSRSPISVASLLLHNQIESRYCSHRVLYENSVARLSGYAMDGTRQDILEFIRVVKVVEFTLAQGT